MTFDPGGNRMYFNGVAGKIMVAISVVIIAFSLFGLAMVWLGYA